jgi:mannose-1-phosphate guanylyltransferase
MRPLESSVAAAMVLCAGYGTRLRPLTEELPKPLVPIGDRSALAHIVAALRAAGVRRFVLNTHHLAQAFVGLAFEDTFTMTVHEAEILGTAGGVSNAAEALGEGTVVVCNGDILAQVDYAALSAQHLEYAPLATIAVAGPLPAGEGTVGIDAAGRVARLRGETYGDEVRGAEFAGAQILSPAARRRLPDEGCLVGDVYMPSLHAGELVRAALVVERWSDVGTPSDYLTENLDWLKRLRRESFVGPGAQVAPDVTLERVVVGAGARVEGQGVMRDVVVWPGALAEAPLERAIVTPGGRVVRC